MLIDLGSFVAYHSTSTTWWVTVDWGDGTTTRKGVAHDGGLGAWAHTYASAGKFQVTVTVEDDWYQSSQAEFMVKVR
jgi:hypothetical protein